jgi:hypothetical protein
MNVRGGAYDVLREVVNMGIDSHLEAFTRSEFLTDKQHASRYVFNFHRSELPILTRRLRELGEKHGDEYEDLANDIETILNEEDTDENN